MRPPRALESGSFRFAILLAAVFALGAAALLTVVERSVGRYATEAAADGVTTEVAILSDEDRAAGRAATVQAIARRERASREHQLRYLLVDTRGRALAGGLPPGLARLGWRDVTLANPDRHESDDPRTVSLMALGTRLADGAILVVASDTVEIEELRGGLLRSTTAFGVGITVLVLVGGFTVGSIFLRRLERVNQSVERIMAGRFTERLPPIGMSPEFDHLSANLNRMLDRIEVLMDGLRQVSTDIAHDLRTPLTRLRQQLEDLKANAPGAAFETQVDGALAQTDRILTIFRALMRIGALEAGAGPRRLVAVDLSEMMERVHRAYLPVAEDGERRLIADIAPAVTVSGDAELLTQAVTNLVENALLHTPRGAEVVIGLARRGSGAAITVADDGLGVPEHERDKVLRRFYRLDSARASPGSGLGLALVAAVATLHQATLTLSDNRPGLRVELFIPARKPS